MAEGPLKRKKTSEAVVDFVLEALFEGRLQTGDRIDIDQVAANLEISRSPVREALVILERDGIVSTRFHRGVYVQRFDAESIVDHFEIYGVLSSVAVARVARQKDAAAAAVAEMQRLLGELAATPPTDFDSIESLVQAIMRLQHHAGGSARLLAELRTFTGFLPWVFRVAGGRSHDDVVKGQAGVIGAIAAGDADGAARYRVEDVMAAGRDVAQELTRRGVFAEHD